MADSPPRRFVATGVATLQMQICGVAAASRMRVNIFPFEHADEKQLPPSDGRVIRPHGRGGETGGS
jgi:hypothetical protein